MQVVMPLEVGIGIGAEDSVRLLLEITERMEMEGLYAAYDRETRADEATPKQMFQLVMLGFMNGIYPTRGLEAACRNDIRFMYLLGGKRVPDHSRFASEYVGGDGHREAARLDSWGCGQNPGP